MRALIVLPIAVSVLLAGCASRPLPKYEQPLARAAVQSVRTTAYTHTESDHVQYSNRNALGGQLQYGMIRSAAADWSRWPAGTIFRIRETGELYRVDDYGWALAGTNTIDLYKPSRAAMNAWGVHRVTIENLQWGDPRQSLSVLQGRSGHRHVQRMITQLKERLPEWTEPPVVSMIAAAPAPPISVPVARAVPVTQPSQVAMARPTARPAQNGTPAGNAPREPFFGSSAR